ncbi:MAG TPA: topoisomerase DNA-binding C4 zinc finger domain-containing protein [Candidatus Angelobacter sp.]|nr:topoisomerase DNA-binding C4 zinc finger domain-containing protein [Candidatus Angelobacter sp.]
MKQLELTHFLYDFYLKEYLDMGLCEIYEVDSSFEESEAGYGTHDRKVTIVARKADRFLKLSVHDHARFGFNSKRNLSVTSEQEISESEYRRLIEMKERVDTLEKVHAVKSNQESLRRRWLAESTLNSIEYLCPQCSAKMHWKSGKYGGFWSCNKYPACTGTRNMSADEKNLLKL